MTSSTPLRVALSPAARFANSLALRASPDLRYSTAKPAKNTSPHPVVSAASTEAASNLPVLSPSDVLSAKSDPSSPRVTQRMRGPSDSTSSPNLATPSSSVTGFPKRSSASSSFICITSVRATQSLQSSGRLGNLLPSGASPRLRLWKSMKKVPEAHLLSLLKVSNESSNPDMKLMQKASASKNGSNCSQPKGLSLIHI